MSDEKAKAEAKRKHEAAQTARAAAVSVTGARIGAPSWMEGPVCNVVPPDYSPLREALKRAGEKWGRLESWPKLRGLLAHERLKGYVVDAAGNPIEVDAKYWLGDLNTFDLEDETIRDCASIRGDALVAFRTDELDAAIPTPQLKAKRALQADSVGAKPKGSISPAELFKHFISLTDGRHTESEYLDIARAKFPSAEIPRGSLRTALKKLPDEKKFGRGEGTRGKLRPKSPS